MPIHFAIRARELMLMPDDWRITTQETYLSGRTLRWSRWTAYKPGWDHDHCEFCWAKFAAEVDDDVEYDTGWMTADDTYHWVCPRCFEDFRERFGWTVEGDGL